MGYLTDTDTVIFTAGSVGLGVGLLISAQEIAFDRWLNQDWPGWDRAISKSIVSAIIWALVLGSLSFITILYEPTKSLATIKRTTILFGFWMGLLAPGITRLGLWTTDRIGQFFKDSQKT
ncbi:MAG: hypothetical protein AAGN15_00340 [Cyanobacteria bacterium J06581_3]